MELKDLNKLITHTKNISRIHQKIRNILPNDFFSNANEPSSENANFIEEVRLIFSNYNRFNNQYSDALLSLEKWKQTLSSLGSRKPSINDIKEIHYLMSLKVPKAEICRKFKISYPTLQKYLAYEIAEEA